MLVFAELEKREEIRKQKMGERERESTMSRYRLDIKRRGLIRMMLQISKNNIWREKYEQVENSEE